MHNSWQTLVFPKVLLSTKIMKNILVFALLFAGNAIAQPVELATSSDGVNTWMGYPETVVATSDRYSMLVERIELSVSSKIYISVESKSCVVGNGVLYGRETSKQPWTKMSVVSLKSPDTIADVLAQTLCVVGQDRKQKNLLKMT